MKETRIPMGHRAMRFDGQTIHHKEENRPDRSKVGGLHSIE